MFFRQTGMSSSWFAIQGASQVTMILLVVAMLFIPVIHQQEEAEALPWFWAGVTVGAAIIGGIAYIIGSHPPHCDHCGDHAQTTDHEYTCTLSGCNYQWNCQTQTSHIHCSPCSQVVDRYDAHEISCSYCPHEFMYCDLQNRAYHDSGDCSQSSQSSNGSSGSCSQ